VSQQPRSPIDFGKALHNLVEQQLKEVPRVKAQKQRTPAEEWALQLRKETARMERFDFAVKAGLPFNNNGAFEEESEDELSPHDLMTEMTLAPSVTDQLNKTGSSLTGFTIMEEINEARLRGTLETFVEGTPIGACHNGPRPCPAPALKSHNEIMDDRQRELRQRQARNDRTLDRLEGRL
jgi:hypothetical protein